jgi:ABC-type lipoprotein release transport system permease subunit
LPSSWAARSCPVLDKVRATPGVEVATGDITDTAQIIGRDGKPAGSGPYFVSNATYDRAFEQILAVLWVLLALAVIVSLLGIVNTLVLATFERMRELGTLRALGMHRRQARVNVLNALGYE